MVNFIWTPCGRENIMNAGRFAGIFAGIFAEWGLCGQLWSAGSNPGAGNQRFYNYVYM